MVKTKRRFASTLKMAAAAGVVAIGSLAASAAAASDDIARSIADHFSSVKTMTGEFVQFGPKGQQIGGKFFIERPGKLRFNYEDPSPVRVISDGKSVVIGNRELKTWDIYPLSKTPLNLLLGERIDLGGAMVKSVNVDTDLTTVVLGDRSIFGNSTITMMFDTETYDLRQWTITDAQGKDTTVMIFEVQTGVKFAESVFEVPYKEVYASRGDR